MSLSEIVMGNLRRGGLGFAGEATRVLAAVVLACATSLLPAQGAAPSTPVLDASALHPPAGARVAIVEFSDLECPACAHANPSLKAAAEQYKIPWIRHDMLIPYHVWSRNGAIYARWFDAKGNGLGNAYRDAVFANQSSIYNVAVLDKFTQDFARSHGIALPFNVDPQGKLAAEVNADSDLSRKTGIQHTPTVFIVMAHHEPSYIEVPNVDTDLYRTIDQALEATKGDAAAERGTKGRREKGKRQ
jgi:protein-disulfide isomerase